MTEIELNKTIAKLLFENPVQEKAASTAAFWIIGWPCTDTYLCPTYGTCCVISCLCHTMNNKDSVDLLFYATNMFAYPKGYFLGDEYREGIISKTGRVFSFG